MAIFGVGDKVILNLEKGSNKLFAEYQGKIAHIQSIDINGWYYVSLHPRGEGVKIPVREYEMEMRYQHHNNWSREQWEMYNNSTTTRHGRNTMKEKKKETPVETAKVCYSPEFLSRFGRLTEEIVESLETFNKEGAAKGNSGVFNVDFVVTTGKDSFDVSIALYADTEEFVVAIGEVRDV